MRKILLLLILLTSLNTSYSQTLSSYNFHAFSCPYDSLTTSFIAYSGLTPGGGGPYDDCYYNSIPIGFNFDYCGATYTSLSASANCWVTLGQTLPFSSTLIVNTYDCDLSGTSTSGLAFPYNLPRPILAPLWIDVVTTGPNVRYTTKGTAPNRVFVIEWSNCGFYNFSGFFPPKICVELLLYETSNIIDFAYKFIASGASSTGLEAIGITDGAGAYPVTGTQPYWSLSDASSAPTASMSVETRNISTLPATDQVYRWSYQCVGQPDAGSVIPSLTNACTSYSSILRLECTASKGAGITYQWQSSSDSLTWTSVSGATVDTYAASVTTLIYYRCILKCTNSGLSDTTAGVKLLINTPPGSISGPTVVCATSSITLSDGTPFGTWSSSATSIATVGSITGIVTGVSGGTVTITYKLPTGCYSIYAVTVNPMPGTITGVKTVCTGFTTALTNSLAGGIWTSSSTSVATVGSSSGIVSGIAPGTASITYSKGIGAVCFTVTTVTVSPTPLSITGTAAVCVGSSISLTDATIGGVWTSANTSVATVGSGTGVVTGVAPGTAIISYTMSTGCAATRIVTVNPLPLPITGVTSICVGRTSNLTDAGGGTWSSSNTSVATVGSSTGLVSGIALGTATITYTLSTGCFVTIGVNVNPNPPTITGITSVCIGGTSTLSNPVPGGTWTSFNPAIANIAPTSGYLTGISAGTTTITYSIITGCYSTIAVTVNPTPSPILGVTKVCLGFTTALSDAFPGGSWSSGNTTVATIGSTSGVVSGLSIGTSTITYASAAGCFITTTVTVNSLPAPIAGPTTVCAGATITLSNPTGGGVWSSSNSLVATVSGSVVVFGVATGTAVITYSVFSTGCIATTTITVSSAPGAISGVAGVCAGATTTLSNTIGGGTWTSGSTSIATIGFTSGIVTGVSPGTASVTYSLGGTCKATATVTVYAPPSPVGGPSSLCSGTTITLTGSGGGTWSSGSTVIAIVGVGTGIVSGISAGTTVISYTVFATGCVATKIVTVNPLPALITGGTTVCIGGTSTLTSATTGGTWSSSSTTIATIGSSTGMVTGIAGGTSAITYKLTGTGCAITATVTVTPPPPPIAGTMNMCIGKTTTLSNTAGAGTWTSGSTAIATVGSSTGIVTGVAAGTATITYTPASGCSVTATVTVDPFPSAITGPTSVCVAASITLINSGGGTWSSGNTAVATIGSSSGIVTGVMLGTTAITYTLPTGCITTTTVTVSPSPVTITGSTNLCIGTTTNLTNAITGGTWTSGNTSVATVGFTSGIVAGVAPGTATISYSLGAGCTVTTIVTVGAGPAAITGSTIICIGATTPLSSTTLAGTWTSSNTAVATIGLSSGIAAGVAVGTTTITYTKGCITITTLTVSPTPVAISGPGSLCQGTTVTLSDAVTGGLWTSSATAVASIGSSSGVVNGLSGGTTVITYSLGSGCLVIKTITVSPVAPITGTTAICNGSSSALSNTIGSGTWSSSNTFIATVGLTTGIVSSVGFGSITIVYTTPAGCTSNTPFSVNPSPTPITGSLSLCSGQTTALSNGIIGGTWTSSNTTVATVGYTSGIVNGLTAGTSTITYSLGASCFVTAVVSVNPSSSVITGPATVCAGSLITLTNAVSGGAWTSGSTAVAAIGSASGSLLGIVPGTTVITYALPSGCSATKVVTVNILPGPITGGTTLCVGQTLALFDATPGGKWSGSPATIASIGSSSGIVSGTAPGIFVVVYTVGTCSATITTTVVPTPTTIMGATPVCVGQTTTLSNSVPGGTWSSGNTMIATIGGSTGAITGVTSGTVLVFYTLGSGCTVFTSLIVNPISPVIGSHVVCSGQTTTLFDTTLGGTWSSANPLIASVGVGTGIVTGSTKGGVVAIIYTSPKGCTASHTVTVTAPPPLITGTMHACVGQTTVLSNPFAGGTWSTGNTLTASVTPLTGIVTGLSAGTAIISYSLGGCPAVTTVTINPVPTAITGPSNVCIGSAIILGSSGGGIWSSSGPAVTVGSSSGIVTGMIPGTAAVTYTLSTGCLAAKTITVSPLPVPITGLTNLCVGGTTSLTDLTPGGTWSSSNTTIATVDAVGLVSGITAGTSVISYTAATGCSSSVTVFVNAPPPPITGATDVCVGSTVILSNATSGGIWSSSITASATIGSSSGIVMGIFAGTSTILYTLPTGCSASLLLTVNPLPAAITGANILCVGFTNPLFNTTPGGMWTSGSTITATVDGIGVVTGMKPGTAAISYTLTTGCSVSMPVTITPLPKPVIGNVYVCLGSTATFSDAIPGGTWSSTNTSVATIGMTSGILSGLSLGPTTIIYTMAAGCDASKTISVVPLPTAYSVTGGGSYCSDKSGVPIGLTGSAVGVNYFLYKGSILATGPLAGTGSALDFGLQTVGGTYTVMAVNTMTGCSAPMSGSVAITVIPAVMPTITIAVNPGDTVCSGDSASFKAMGTGGGSAPLYRWDVNGTVVTTDTMYKFIPANGDVITCRYTSNAVCATASVVTTSVAMKVIVPQIPSATLSTFPGDTICEGSKVTLTPLPVYGGSAPSYVWVVNGVSAGTGSTFTYVPADKDIVYCKMTSNYLCLATTTVPSNNVVMTVDSPQIPHVVIQASPGTYIAKGKTDTLTAIVSDAGLKPQYQWFRNGLPIPGATTNRFISDEFGYPQSDSITCFVTSSGLCNLTTFNWVYITVYDLSVTQASSAGNLTIVPNPNKGEFTLKGATGSNAPLALELTNLLGQVVYHNKLEVHNGTINERIKLSNTLANGMYILTVRSETLNEVFHMVIEQ